MHIARRTGWWVLSAALLLAIAARAQERPEFFPLAKCLKTGEKKQTEAVDCDLEVYRSTGTVRVVSGVTVLLKLEKAQITNIVYERVTRQHLAAGVFLAWPVTFPKGRKHFLTVQYKRDDGKSDFLPLSLDRSNYERALVSLEEATGVRVERHLNESN